MIAALDKRRPARQRQSIGEDAFAYCNSLTSIIPEGVIIDFYECTT
ncbi:MAG: hypothetical protein ACLRSW_16220 [Christensenellaceae bacterium]